MAAVAWQGVAKFGNHSLTVIASGSRIFVTNDLFPQHREAKDEINVLNALTRRLLYS
jgi:hypothetical protein